MTKGSGNSQHKFIETYRIYDPELSEETCPGKLKRPHQSTQLLGNAFLLDPETQTQGPSNRVSNHVQLQGGVDTGFRSLCMTVGERSQVEQDEME